MEHANQPPFASRSKRIAMFALFIGLGALGCGGRGKHRTPAPTPPTGSTSETVAISNFFYFSTCKLTPDGVAHCRTLLGQQRRIEGVAEIGELCLRMRNGDVRCTNNTLDPPHHSIDGVGKIRAMDESNGLACAVRTSGTVVCWEMFEKRAWKLLELAAPPSPAIDVAVGDPICARLQNGKIACWKHQPGARPSMVPGIENARQIAVARGGVCAVTKRRHVWCWGDNEYGQLGDGTMMNDRQAPRRVVGLSDVRQLAAADASFCAVANAQVKCWGGRSHSNHGERMPPFRCLKPTRVKGLGKVRSLWLGTDLLCVFRVDGTHICRTDDPRTAELMKIKTSSYWHADCGQEPSGPSDNKARVRRESPAETF